MLVPSVPCPSKIWKNNKLIPFAALIISIIWSTDISANNQLDPLYDPTNFSSPFNPHHPINNPELFKSQPSINSHLDQQKDKWMLIFFWGVTLFIAAWITYSILSDRKSKKIN